MEAKTAMNKISLIIFLTLSVAACSGGPVTAPSIQVGENGVSIDTGTGSSVEAGDNGVSIEEGNTGASVEVGSEGTNVESGETDVTTGETGSTVNIGADNSELETFEIVGMGQVVVANYETKVNLAIAGSNNTVDIETPIGDLSVTGFNNLVRFAAGVTVDTCSVVGSDLMAEKGEGVDLSCDIDGSGIIGFD